MNPQDIQERFEKLLTQTLYSVNSTRYKIEKVLDTRGNLNCIEGHQLISSCKKLGDEIITLFMLVGLVKRKQDSESTGQNTNSGLLK